MTTYETVVEVSVAGAIARGVQPVELRIPFTLDWEGEPQVSQATAGLVLKAWQDQQDENAHWLIDAKGMLRVQYRSGDKQVINEAPFDGDWNISLSWLQHVLFTGDLSYGPIIGQPELADLVKAADAAEAVASKFKAADGEQWFTITDLRLAAQEAVLLALKS